MWTNWARTHASRPVRRVAARDVDDAVAAVRSAVADGLPVRAVGSGHSGSAVAMTDGVLVDVSRLDHLHAVDGTRVTVGAGIRLRALSRLLWEHGLALETLGDIDVQTLAGALATGTHGTGLAFGGLASRVRALQVVLADGAVVTCSPAHRPDLFEAARVGLGAFGVVTAVTLEAVPAFALRSVERRVVVDDVLEVLDDLVAVHDHVDLYWFPQSRWGMLKTHERVPADAVDPLPRWRTVLDDELIANAGLEAVCRVGTALPGQVPRLNALAGRLVSTREYADRSYRVFASPRRVRFRESEVAVPLADARAVFEELRAWVRREGGVSFPLEVRVGAAEDAWLALAHGRRTAYVSAQTFHRQPHERYFAALAGISAAVRGRPHWGKMHELDAAALAPLYPRFDDVRAVRDAVDPGRVFTNPYVARVLGA